jgi:hypothetical protein
MSVWLIALLAFLLIAFGSLALGRWLQRKGTEIERGHGRDEPPPDA